MVIITALAITTNLQAQKSSGQSYKTALRIKVWDSAGIS